MYFCPGLSELLYTCMGAQEYTKLRVRIEVRSMFWLIGWGWGSWYCVKHRIEMIIGKDCDVICRLGVYPGLTEN